MSNIVSYRDLRVWVAATDLCVRVYRFTDLFPKTETYGLSSQLRRAMVSIPSNIAEGNGRWHKGNKKQVFWVARGSVFECVAVVQAANRQHLIGAESYGGAYATLESLSKMLIKLIQSVESMRSAAPSKEQLGEEGSQEPNQH